MPRSPSLKESRESIARGGDGGTGGPVDEGGGGGGGDRLVKVAFAPNQMEAEMIQGLLREHGIESMLKRGPGFDVPEFLASRPAPGLRARGGRRGRPGSARGDPRRRLAAG